MSMAGPCGNNARILMHKQKYIDEHVYIPSSIRDNSPIARIRSRILVFVANRPQLLIRLMVPISKMATK